MTGYVAEANLTCLTEHGRLTVHWMICRFDKESGRVMLGSSEA